MTYHSISQLCIPMTWQSKMAMGFSFTVGDVPVEITRNSSGISPDAGGKTSGWAEPQKWHVFPYRMGGLKATTKWVAPTPPPKWKEDIYMDNYIYTLIFKRALISGCFLVRICFGQIERIFPSRAEICQTSTSWVFTACLWFKKNRPHNERNFPQSSAISRKRAHIWKVVVFKSSCTSSRNW